MLTRAQDLASSLDRSTAIVFDCRHDLFDHAKGRLAYDSGHIPGAFFVPVETALSGAKSGRNGRHPLPDPHAFAQFLAAQGVTPDTPLVAYDDAGGLYAARLWWLARWIGLTHVSLLDGGITQWIKLGFPLSTETPQPRPSPSPLPVKVGADSTVSTDTLQSNLAEGRLLVVDARAAERYRGEVETIDTAAGHLPGAVNRFYRENLLADGTFRDPAELRSAWSRVVDPRSADQIVHQCGSGITACANLFAMEYAGLSGSKLYPGSWSEWISDSTRPIAKGPA